MRAIVPAVAWLAFSGCATSPDPVEALEPLAPIASAPQSAKPSLTPRILASTPIPNPPERPLVRSPARKAKAENPLARVAKANAAARVQPRLEGYANAAQVYAFSESALYQVYATPGRVTDIMLQPQEKLAGAGPVAAGDTTRWVIGDTESGSGAEQRVHILVKPTRGDLLTNLVINTDRRTYHLELRATASTYMAAVSWRYPADEARAAAADAEARRVAQAEAAALQAPSSAALNFGYRIQGRAAWRPVRVYDDGRQTFIEFPGSVAQGEMPPLFVVAAGGVAELVNYRVHGRRMIVDRIFDQAELRLGDRRGRQRVRLSRLVEDAS
ncbi:P-type conjugative transfer protein TrbG [Phenylobacterium sp.]|uniref:P-type conjugative transfer protein TrbG n=1 Tax=Phenylobacterium sp. TaxID=1871053 RepID=UPI002FCC2E44